MAPDHPTVAQVKLAQRWHTDSSYRATIVGDGPMIAA
jgi:hypothetical protein